MLLKWRPHSRQPGHPSSVARDAALGRSWSLAGRIFISQGAMDYMTGHASCVDRTECQHKPSMASCGNAWSRVVSTCLQGAGPEVAGDGRQLAGEGQQVEVGGQAERQPGIALRVLHQLHQLPRALVLACVRGMRKRPETLHFTNACMSCMDKNLDVLHTEHACMRGACRALRPCDPKMPACEAWVASW